MTKVPRGLHLAGVLFMASVSPAWSGVLEAQVRVDTLRGIPVARNLARRVLRAPPELQPREVFRVGSVSGPSETLFPGPLISVSKGPQGQLAVLDQQSMVIRLFGPSGTFLREFGRPGRGPGDLSAPTALTWDRSARLWVPEPFERRYSVFDTLGQFVTTVPRPFFRGVNRRVYPILFRADNTLLDHASFAGGAGFFRVDTEGLVLDSFPPIRYPPNPLTGVVAATRDREWTDAVRAFLPRLIWTLAPDGTLWFASSDSLRLIHRTLRGDTLRIIEAAHRPSVFSRAERRVVDRVASKYEHVPLRPAVVQSLHASDNGLLLVQIAGEMGTPGHEVDVFDPEGRYLGTFSLDLPIQPLSQSAFARGRFSYVGVGPLDVPIVVETRLGR